MACLSGKMQKHEGMWQQAKHRVAAKYKSAAAVAVSDSACVAVALDSTFHISLIETIFICSTRNHFNYNNFVV